MGLKIAITFTFVLGALIFLYPFIANGINYQVDKQRLNKLQTRMVENDEILKTKKREREEEIKKNPYLGMKLESELFEEVEKRHTLSKKEIEEHLIGAVSIPKIGLELPIFDITNASFLQEGLTLLPGSSYPIGGKSTHSVLTGHTGLPNKKLLTDLVDVVEGDEFYVKALGETIAYKIDQIKVVEPDELDDLLIKKNKDYLTLVTCTPYMVNTHRLLVRGERIAIDYREVVKREKEIDKKNRRELIFYLILAICLIILLLYVFYLQYKRYRILKRKYSINFKIFYKGKAKKGVTFELMDYSMRHSIKIRNKKVIVKSDKYGNVKIKKIKGDQYWLIKKGTKGKPLQIICHVRHVNSINFEVKISKKSNSNWMVKQRKEKKK